MHIQMKEEAMLDWKEGPGEDIGRVLYTADDIDAKVQELGRDILADYRGRNVILVGILNGCFPFMADLVRAMNLRLEVDFMAVSSYGNGVQSSGIVRILKDLNVNIQGRHVLLVEDIIDTGLTARYLLDNLRTRKPASMEIVSLLDKREARTEEVAIKYVGFECPDEYVVGYGLDYNQLYRNLPFIGVLKKEVYAGP